MRLKYLRFLVLILSHVIYIPVKATNTSTSTTSTSKPVILLVEDRDFDLKFTLPALKKYNERFEIVIAKNMDEAIHKLQAHQPVLVITDGNLGEGVTKLPSNETSSETETHTTTTETVHQVADSAKDGIALLKMIKHEHPNIPVIVYSNEDEKYLAFALKNQAAAAIKKTRHDELRGAVDQALGLHISG